MRPVEFLQSLIRAFRWHRRGFAALFAALAVLAGLNALTASEPGDRSVVVAAHPIPAGARLARSDLQLGVLSAAAVPEGALTDLAQAEGLVVVAPVPSRRALVASDLLGDESQVASGKVALPVRFGEAASVSLLRVGGRVDVLGPTSDGGGHGVVASQVRVVAIPVGTESGLLGGAETTVVLLEVTAQDAAAITAAASISALSFALR